MNNLRIKDMAPNEKPIEKLVKYGAERLSDAELLAIILRSGSRKMSVIETAQRILNDHPIHKGLQGLNHRHLNELTKIPGVGTVKGCQIIALTEISRRMSSEICEQKLTVDSPETVADYFMEEVRYLEKERVYALFVDSANCIIHRVLISEGSINRSLMDPRELFKEALKANATSIILVHNHPSGNPEPSDIDILVTKKIEELGNKLGIKLHDHIIIGNGIYESFLNRGILK